MEVLIVFLVILAITALLYWASLQLGAPPPIAVVIAVVGILIALWYLGVNADEIDLDDDDGHALFVPFAVSVRKLRQALSL